MTRTSIQYVFENGLQIGDATKKSVGVGGAPTMPPLHRRNTRMVTMARATRACSAPTARIFSSSPLLFYSFTRFEGSVRACGARLAHLPSSAHVHTVRCARLAARNPSPPPSLLSPLLPSLLLFPYFSSFMTGLAALDLYFLALAALAPCRSLRSQ
jgi:hypothetical protein